MIMKKLEQFARERGYTLKRKSREVTWIRNDNKQIQGKSSCVAEAYQDISEDYALRLKSKQ